MEEFVDRAIEYASKMGSYVETSYLSSERNTILMKNGSVSATGYSKDSGLAFRVVNSSISFASSNISDWGVIRGEIDYAVRRSKIPGRNTLSEEKSYRDSWEVAERRRIKDVPLEEKLSILKDIESLLVKKGYR